MGPLATLDHNRQRRGSSDPGNSSNSIYSSSPTQSEQSQPSNLQFGQQLYTVTLQGCRVLSDTTPSLVLYQLSDPISSTSTPVSSLTVHRAKYRQQQQPPQSHQRIHRPQLAHIYDLDCDIYGNVSLNGIRPHRNTCRTYDQIPVEGNFGGWNTCSAGPFKATYSVGGRSRQQGQQLIWKHAATGRLVAVENVPSSSPTTSPFSEGSGLAGRLPATDGRDLHVKAVMSEQDFDLLVSCWLARIWREESDRRERSRGVQQSRLRASPASSRPSSFFSTSSQAWTPDHRAVLAG